MVGGYLSDLIMSNFTLKGSVRVFSNPDDLKANFQPHSSSGVILDFLPFGPKIFNLFESLRAMHPKVKGILISGHHTSYTIKRSKEVGITGLFSKDIAPANLIVGLRECFEGRFATGGDCIDKLFANYEYDYKVHPLSHRENQILDYLVSGKTVRSISIEIGISVNTVKVYKNRLFKKMDSKNISELLSKHFYYQQSRPFP
jgi:DNA-binding NarL/FixJ family response regulator